MKRALLLALLPLALIGQAATPVPEGYTLLFADEFDKPGLPDPAKWRYEEGWVRNQEAQWYSKADPANTWVTNGTLRLTGLRLPKPRPNPYAKNAALPAADVKNPRPSFWGAERPAILFTSGSIETRGLFSFQYGRVDVRARLPQGQGVWPAIWTLGVKGRHPDCGEIDIMEYVWSSPQTVWSTLHFPGREKIPTSQRSGGHTGPDVQDGQFHLYTLEWDAERMVFSFDGKPYYTYPIDRANQPDGTNPFRQPHYLKLNLALGTKHNWGGDLDPAILPQTFEVDYVRVYRKLRVYRKKP